MRPTGLIIAAAAALIGLALTSVGTELCFKSGERDAGMNKICYYSCPSGDAAITVKSTKLCPLSIKR